MEDKITITVNNDGAEMKITLPQSVNISELVDNLVMMLCWLTFQEESVQSAFADYLEEKGWDVSLADEDD